MKLGLQERLQQCLFRLKKKDSYGFFLQPVDLAAYPEYLDVVKEPMDFSTMHMKLARGDYEDFTDFRRDFLLIVDNCIAFNLPESVFVKAAISLKEFGKSFLEREATRWDEDFLQEYEKRAAMQEQLAQKNGGGSSSGPGASDGHKKRGRKSAAEKDALAQQQATSSTSADGEKTDKPKGRGRGRAPPGARPIQLPPLPPPPVIALHSKKKVKVLPTDYRPEHDCWNCSVCDDDVEAPDDLLLRCASCAVTVHQSCYGVRWVGQAPGKDAAAWLCDPCSSGAATKDLACALCPNAAGSLKPTASGVSHPIPAGVPPPIESSGWQPWPAYTPAGTCASEWAHVLCATYVPEVAFADIARMGPILGVDKLNPKRRRLQCKVCKQTVGGPVQCSRSICGFTAHVTCARNAKLEMGYYEEDSKAAGGSKFSFHCNKHADLEPEDPSRWPYADRMAYNRARIRQEYDQYVQQLQQERDRVAAKLERHSARVAGEAQAASSGSGGPAPGLSKLQADAIREGQIHDALTALSAEAAADDAGYDSSSDAEGNAVQSLEAPAEQEVEEEEADFTEVARTVGPKRRGRPPKQKLQADMTSADVGSSSMALMLRTSAGLWAGSKAFFMKVKPAAAEATLSRMVRYSLDIDGASSAAGVGLLKPALVNVHRHLHALRMRDSEELGYLPRDDSFTEFAAQVSKAVHDSEALATRASSDPDCVPVHVWVRLLQSLASRTGNMYASLYTDVRDGHPLVPQTLLYKPGYEVDAYGRLYASDGISDKDGLVFVADNATLASDPTLHHNTFGTKRWSEQTKQDLDELSDLRMSPSSLTKDDPAFVIPPLGARNSLVLDENSNVEIVSTALQFGGWGDGTDFSEIRKAFPPAFTGPMTEVAHAAKLVGLCKDTHFRFAKVEDAPIIHVLNRVNDAFRNPSDFRNTISAKNEFIIVSTRDVVVNGQVEEHVTGFVSFYCLWYKPKNTLAKSAEKCQYVATLQAVKPDSHGDVMGIATLPSAVVPSSRPGGYGPGRRNREQLPASSPVPGDDDDDTDDDTEMPMPSPSLGTSSLQIASSNTIVDSADVLEKRWYPHKSRNPGSEARTGTILLSLAFAFAKSHGLSSVLIDSTAEAQAYYLQTVGLSPLIPSPTYPYFPMHSDLAVYDPLSLALGKKHDTAAFRNKTSFDSGLADLRTAQAVLSNLLPENQCRMAVLLSRIHAEAQLSARPAACNSRRLDRRVWRVYGNEQLRRGERMAAERKRIEEESTAVCGCCGGGDSYPKDNILFCDNPGCNLAVHQQCYGIIEVPEGQWFCAPCESGLQHPAQLSCIVCRVHGGPLRPVPGTGDQDGGRARQWAHPHCLRLAGLLAAPGMGLLEDGTVVGATTSEWLKRGMAGNCCCVCGSSAGSALTCAVPGCEGCVHPNCALQCGLVTKHAPQTPEQAGVTVAPGTPLCAVPYMADGTLPMHPREVAALLGQCRPTQGAAVDNGEGVATSGDFKKPYVYCAAHRLAFPDRLQQEAQDTSEAWQDHLEHMARERRPKGKRGGARPPKRLSLPDGPPKRRGRPPKARPMTEGGEEGTAASTGEGGGGSEGEQGEDGSAGEAGQTPMRGKRGGWNRGMRGGRRFSMGRPAASSFPTEQGQVTEEGSGMGEETRGVDERPSDPTSSTAAAHPTSDMSPPSTGPAAPRAREEDEEGARAEAAQQQEQQAQEQGQQEDAEEEVIPTNPSEPGAVTRKILEEWQELVTGRAYMPVKGVPGLERLLAKGRGGTEGEEGAGQGAGADGGVQGEGASGTDAKVTPGLAPPLAWSRTSSSSSASPPCAVCGLAEACRLPEEGTEGKADPHLQCGACGVTVHASCYRCTVLAPGLPWLCDPCADQAATGHLRLDQPPAGCTTPCCLCGASGGAMKATDHGLWAHVACALFIPETSIERAVSGHGWRVTGAVTACRDRAGLRCHFCKAKGLGAPIQCFCGTCRHAYHVTCGMAHGWFMGQAVQAPGTLLAAAPHPLIVPNLGVKPGKGSSKAKGSTGPLRPRPPPAMGPDGQPRIERRGGWNRGLGLRGGFIKKRRPGRPSAADRERERREWEEEQAAIAAAGGDAAEQQAGEGGEHSHAGDAAGGAGEDEAAGGDAATGQQPPAQTQAEEAEEEAERTQHGEEMGGEGMAGSVGADTSADDGMQEPIPPDPSPAGPLPVPALLPLTYCKRHEDMRPQGAVGHRAAFWAYQPAAVQALANAPPDQLDFSAEGRRRAKEQREGGGGRGGGTEWVLRNTSHGYPATLLLNSSPLATSPSVPPFFPLLRVLVCVYGWMVNVGACSTARRLTARLRPPTVRRQEKKLAEEVADEIEGAAEKLNYLSGPGRLLFGRGCYLDIDLAATVADLSALDAVESGGTNSKGEGEEEGWVDWDGDPASIVKKRQAAATARAAEVEAHEKARLAQLDGAIAEAHAVIASGKVSTTMAGEGATAVEATTHPVLHRGRGKNRDKGGGLLADDDALGHEAKRARTEAGGRAGAGAASAVPMQEDEGPEGGAMDEEQDDDRYCICRSGGGGEMVGCDIEVCPHGEWFHLACVGLLEAPAEDQPWCCPGCTKDKAMAAGGVVEPQGDLAWVQQAIQAGVAKVYSADAGHGAGGGIHSVT